MARPRRSRRTLTTVVVLVLLSITIITFDERGGGHALSSGFRSLASDIFSPLVGGVNDILRPIGDFFAGAVHYGALQQENQKLQATVGRLERQAAENADAARQLQQIEALRELPGLTGLNRVEAQTIEYQPTNFGADIVIDKGRGQGVAVGEPVIGGAGLIGQVAFASHSTAIVQLLTDGQSSVGVYFGAKNALSGTLQGQGPGKPLSLEFVPPQTSLKVGEKLYTSNLPGAAYPAGIPVAKISSFHTVTGASQITITATPLANLGQLPYVEVVQWEPPS